MPLMTWATHVLQWDGTTSRELARASKSLKKNRSQFGLQAATRLHEVGIASNRGSACRGEYVPGLVHTARHTMRVL